MSSKPNHADLAGERLLLAMDLSDLMMQVRRQRMRRDHPGVTNAEISGLLLAELGSLPLDGDGVPGTWPRTPRTS